MDDNDELVQMKKSDLVALREANRQLQALQPQFEAMQRESAFSRAGIDVNDRHLGYFVKGYAGELNPEAIRTAAEADGFLKAKSAPQPPQQELKAHEAMMSASEGSEPVTGDQWSDAMSKANNVEEVMIAAGKFGYPTSWNRRDS